MTTVSEHYNAEAGISQSLLLDALASSPTNPRKTFPEAAMAELTESVRQLGILQPILVRPWPEEYAFDGRRPFFEVVAGERRYRAARSAGMIRIPALMRELTTREVLEIQVVENLQRQDLHPLEEAEGYGLMMHEHGYTAEQLAEKIGKSRSYIFGRLKLLALDADSRRLFSGGVLNASTALLVARIPTTTLRTKAIKEITEPDYHGDTKSVRQAQRWIHDRYMLKLVDANFPINDATLAGGSCADCPKRTGNVRDLFEDVDSPDVCTDPDCYGAKKLAVMQRNLDKAKESGAEVITGKEAKKLAPYGVSDYGTINNYTQLDKKCYEDKEQRTYREILGEAIEVTLIEDKEHSRLVPVVKNTLLAEKLKEAGIESGEERNAKEKKAVEAKLATERAYRDRLFANVRTEIGSFTQDGVVTLRAEMIEFILMRMAGQLFGRLYGDVQSRISLLWQAEGKNATERNANFLDLTLPQLNAGELWRVLVDLITIGGVSVSQYMTSEPKALLDMAALFGINTVEVRKSVVSELKAREKSEKPVKTPSTASKKGKKPATEPSAEAPPPAKAAQAGDSLRADEAEALKVGYRVRIRDDIEGSDAWKKKICGREGIIEAMTAIGLSVRTGPGIDGLLEHIFPEEVERILPGAEAAQAGGQSATEEAPAAAGIIEMNETPTGAESAPDALSGDAPAWVNEVMNEKPAGAKSAVMYKHPDGATWTGRGRRPAWVNAWLEIEGNTLDMVKVAA